MNFCDILVIMKCIKMDKLTNFRNFHELNVYIKYKSTLDFCIIQKEQTVLPDVSLPLLVLGNCQSITGTFSENSTIEVPGFSQQVLQSFFAANNLYNSKVNIYFPKSSDTILSFEYPIDNEPSQTAIDYYYQSQVRHYTLYSTTSLPESINNDAIEAVYYVIT